jgi:hypothetical protein
MTYPSAAIHHGPLRVESTHWRSSGLHRPHPVIMSRATHKKAFHKAVIDSLM